MPVPASLVTLPNQPPLNDIPGRLRLLADQLECGDVRTALVLTESSDGQIDSFCYGTNPTRNEVIGLYTRAAAQVAARANHI